jgi:Ser/Thr protein kinase RdoA (MazF antagonist)
MLVARAWPPDGRDRNGLEQVHRWLPEAARLGFVPVPIPALDGRTLQEQGGRLWELAPWLPGRPERLRPPPLPRLRAGFEALAAFHQSLALPALRGPSPGLARRLQEIDSLRSGGFALMDRALVGRAGDPRAPAGRRWLDLARRLVHRVAEHIRQVSAQPVSLQPCLRDVRPDHLLFEGDRLTGLVDFGAMDVDSIATDIARLLAEWVGADGEARAEALATYTSVRPLDETETVLIEVFEASGALLGGGHWVRWHFVEGRKFDDPSAVARGLERGIERLGLLVTPIRAHGAASLLDGR